MTNADYKLLLRQLASESSLRNRLSWQIKQCDNLVDFLSNRLNNNLESHVLIVLMQLAMY